MEVSYDFPKIFRPILTKMSKISINTEVNIDEVEQKTLLTICTTKLHRYYRVTLHFLDFHQKIFPKITPPFIKHPLLLPSQEYRLNFRKLSWTKNFAGINFCESDLFKDFVGVNLTFAFRNIFSTTLVYGFKNNLNKNQYFFYLRKWQNSRC